MNSNRPKLDLYKSKRHLALFLYILISVFMISSIILNSFAFSNENFVVQDREISVLFNEMSNKGVSYFYTNTTFSNREKKCAESMFRSVYTKNLTDDGYQHILTVSNNDSILKSSTSFGEENLPFTSSITNALVYSNKDNPPQFETLLINLFKHRERAVEIKYDPTKYQGFTYIPDYFADYIIEHSAAVSTYNDLLDNEVPFVLTVGGEKIKYKIANIFCVNGFKKEYCGDVEPEITYDYGKLLSDFFTHFCVVSNINPIMKISENYNMSVVSMLVPKRFVLMDTLNAVHETSKLNSDSAKIDLYYTDGKNIVYYENSETFSQRFLYPESSTGWGFKIFSLVVYVVSIAILSYTFYKFSSERHFYIFTLSQIGGLLFILILFSILRKTSLMATLTLYFNAITVSLILLYMLCLLLLTSSIFIRKKKKQ